MQTDKVLELAHMAGLTHYMEQHLAFDNRIHKLAVLIESELIKQGWKAPEQVKKAVEDKRDACANTAAMFSINKNPIIPDVAVDDMNDNAKFVYHATCQCVAEAIRARSANE